MDSKILKIRLIGDAKSAQRAVKSAESGFTGLGKKVLKIGAGLATLNVGKNIVMDMARVGMAYDDTMNAIQAASGATEKQMGRVADKARELGADLTLPGTSAADSTAAMLELYKGGLKLSDAMDAAKGSIQLASAAGVENAQAAQIQANAISIFSLKASEATHVADALANVANAATGEITDVATALSYVGPSAAAVGMSIDDTSAAIGLLGRNAIIGSKAGTGLRIMLSSLDPISKRATKAMKLLGIEAFNASGEFKGMRYVTDKLAEARKNLTKEEFLAATRDAFGRQGMAASAALAKEGAKGFDSMRQAVLREGAAAEIAKAKNKGFHGALDGLRSQIEDFYLLIWQKASPKLDEFTRKLADGVQKANGFIRNFKLSKLTDAINNFDGDKAGDALAKAMGKMLSKLGGLAKTIAKTVGGWAKDVDWVGLGIELGKAAVPMILGLALGILNFDLGSVLSQLASHWEEVLFGILTLVFMPAKWAAKLAGLLRKIPFVGRLLGWIVEALSSVGTKIKSGISKFFGTMWGAFKNSIGLGGKTIKGSFKNFFLTLQTRIGVWLINLGERMAKGALRMAEKFGRWLGEHGPKQALDALRKIKTKVFSFFSTVGGWLARFGGKLLRGLWDGIKGSIGWIGSKLGEVKSKVLGVFKDAVNWLRNAGKDVIQGFINGIGDMFGSVAGKLGELTGKLTSWKGPPRKDRVILRENGHLVMDGFMSGLADRFGPIKRNLMHFTSMLAGKKKGIKLHGLGGAALASWATNMNYGNNIAGFGGLGSLDEAGLLADGGIYGGSGNGGGGGGYSGGGGSGGGSSIVVKVIVDGPIVGEKDFAKRIAPVIRDELAKIGKRNNGRILTA